MIVAQIAKNKNDEYFTPKYAVDPILKYLKPNSTIWCPFDKDFSEYVKVLRGGGHKVIFSHIDNGEDFFNMEVPECDYIISNPPYSKKGEVLNRLFELKIPFAMLVGVVGLFESQFRFNLFKNNDFELLYFNKRIDFLDGLSENLDSKCSPPFSSIYVCHNILPKQIVFEEINKVKI